MNNEDREITNVDLQIDFLKSALTYLENRINLVDNKASILMVIQGGLFALFEWSKRFHGVELISDMLFLNFPLSFLLDFFVFLLTGFTMLLLIQTVRPAKYILNVKVHLKKLDKDEHLMWFGNRFPDTADNYREKLEELRQLGKSEVLRNYSKQHYSALQLIRRKYKYYRWAGFLLKIMIVAGFFRLLLLPDC